MDIHPLKKYENGAEKGRVSFGYGALPDKMLLVIVTLIVGNFCPAGLQPPGGARKREKNIPLTFINYPRSSLLPGSAPDPIFY